MCRTNVKKDDVIKIKALFDKGFSENEIVRLGLCDFASSTINKVKNGYYDSLLNEDAKEIIVSFSESDIKVLLEQSQKYDMLLNVIFNHSKLDNTRENTLYMPLAEINSFVRSQENERYNRALEKSKEEY